MGRPIRSVSHNQHHQQTELSFLSRVRVPRPQKQSEWSVPMTSADWNRDSTDLVAVGSMDTTVTVYDVQAREDEARDKAPR